MAACTKVAGEHDREKEIKKTDNKTVEELL